MAKNWPADRGGEKGGQAGEKELCTNFVPSAEVQSSSLEARADSRSGKAVVVRHVCASRALGMRRRLTRFGGYGVISSEGRHNKQKLREVLGRVWSSLDGETLSWATRPPSLTVCAFLTMT